METAKVAGGRMIKLLIVDDEPIIRIGLKALFSERQAKS